LCGFAVPIKLLQEKPELVKKLLRARAKGNRYFLENEREASELLARLYRVDVKTALESYRSFKARLLRRASRPMKRSKSI
jgi:ABC-type nitrate/sulfonate/bicarbonate transport system substrate-binding protein